MIGTDQEPPRDVLERLQAEIGEVEVSYYPSLDGVTAAVRARTEPPREELRTWRIEFASSLGRPQIEALWRSEAERMIGAWDEATAPSSPADDLEEAVSESSELSEPSEPVESPEPVESEPSVGRDAAEDRAL